MMVKIITETINIRRKSTESFTGSDLENPIKTTSHLRGLLLIVRVSIVDVLL
jgi:hypothetical protein